MNNKINLVLASDQNYVKLLVPCIISILHNKKPTTEYDIYILESGISDFDKQKIKELEKFNNINNCTINFIDINKDFSNINQQTITDQTYYTVATLYRLAIPKLFKHLERILYLDVDTIVTGDLLEFYNQDFGNNYACIFRGNEEIQGVTTKLDNNTSIIEKYNINAGVILFNLTKINADNKDNNLLDFSQYPKRLPYFYDQDIIAHTFKPYIKPISYRYNTTVFSDEDAPNDPNDLKQAIIIHYVTRIKPTNFKKLYKVNPIYKEFFKYLQMSYLKMNSVKLQLIIIIASIKRLRRQTTGIKTINGKKVFYIGKLQIKL